MKNIVINFPPDSPLRHIIFKEKNMTVYFSNYDSFLDIVEMSDELVDPNYNDEGHFHFEIKDKSACAINDIQTLLSYLTKYKLISKDDEDVIINHYIQCTQEDAKPFSIENENISPHLITNNLFNPKKRKLSDMDRPVIESSTKKIKIDHLPKI